VSPLVVSSVERSTQKISVKRMGIHGTQRFSCREVLS
jgi:hypothetical protein